MREKTGRGIQGRGSQGRLPMFSIIVKQQISDTVMARKIDPDSTAGVKLLRMFRKLLLDGKRHYQSALAKELECSPQTIIRLAREIESVVGDGLKTGLENRRRWYQLKMDLHSSPGPDDDWDENAAL